MASSRPAPQSLIVAADLLGVLRRDGLAVDRHERLAPLLPQQLLGDLVAQLDEGAGNEVADEVPVWFLRVTVELGSDLAGTLADGGGLGAQALVTHHLLHGPQPVRPGAEVAAGQGADELLV